MASPSSQPASFADSNKTSARYVCFHCNQLADSPHMGHKLYKITSFWKSILGTLIVLGLVKAASLLVPVKFRLLGFITVHGLWLVMAGLVAFAYLMTSLQQAIRGGAGRLLVPQFAGLALGSIIAIVADLLLFPVHSLL